MPKNDGTFSGVAFWSWLFLTVVLHPNRSGDDQEVLFDQILMGQVDFPSPYWDNVSDSAKVGLWPLPLPRSLRVLLE